MKFKVGETRYQIDMWGVVHQVDVEPFVYDEKYCATYDTEEYKRQSDILQALRYSFACGSHGKINSLIDVGYGNGAFMKFAKQLTPIVGGLDVSGVKVPEGCYRATEFEPVDVVTFFDSLEHIPDLMFVRDIPAKTIVISLPYCHIDVRGVEWFANEYYHLKKNEHLHHFNQQSLIGFMDNMGWEVVSIAKLEDAVRKRDKEWNILTASFKRKTEIWMPIKGWEDKYEVSSFGRIKSLPRIIGAGYMSQERILKQSQDRDGYKMFSFPLANRKNVSAKVHKIVATHFCANPENKPFINHKNGVNWHNYASNLEFVTASQNVKHGFDYNGRKIENKSTRKPILQYSLSGDLIKEWESGLQMEKEGGFDRASIKQAIEKGKNYYGFKWEFKNKDI